MFVVWLIFQFLWIGLTLCQVRAVMATSHGYLWPKWLSFRLLMQLIHVCHTFISMYWLAYNLIVGNLRCFFTSFSLSLFLHYSSCINGTLSRGKFHPKLQKRQKKPLASFFILRTSSVDEIKMLQLTGYAMQTMAIIRNGTNIIATQLKPMIQPLKQKTSNLREGHRNPTRTPASKFYILQPCYLSKSTPTHR